MLLWLIHNVAHFFRKSFTAIRAEEIANSDIEGNICKGTDLLEARKIRGSLIRGNEVFHQKSQPPLLKSIVVDILVGLTIAFLIYKFGWNK